MTFVAPNYDSSVSSLYKAWCNEALSRMRWDMNWNGAPFDVTITVAAEPPCPGHDEFMCTQTTNGVSVITIRDGVEQNMQDSMHVTGTDIQKFFMESIIHEYGHVWTFSKFATDENVQTRVCEMFHYERDGSGTGRKGTQDDWDGDHDWSDKIKEAVAEWFKDLYMPLQYRVFDNRTNWQFTQSSFTDWWDAVDDAFCYGDQGPVTNT